MVTRILVAESRTQVRETIRTLLLGLGCHSIETGDVETALRCLDRDRPALTIVGCIGGASADAGRASLDLARQLRSRRPDLPLLFFAADSTEALAIDALKAGVTDYIKQPCFNELAQAVARWVGATPVASPDQEELLAGPPIAGAGAALARVRQYLRKVAAADCTVLITGETGTGKELAAHAIHANSARRSKPFVTINCAAIPDELVESELFGFERGAFTGAHTSNAGRLMQADGGTAFLDEIGELNAHAQAKMLRVIENKELQRLGASQNRPVDIRIIAATNQDLGQMVELKPIPSRPVFPAERCAPPLAALARTARGHPAADRSVPS
jgi:two-component system nitrogen regulation response regulator GlnG